MSKIRETINDDSTYGVAWAEFIISFILAGIIRLAFYPTAWMTILLPVVWLIVHYWIGDWLKKHSKGDLFGRD